MKEKFITYLKTDEFSYKIFIQFYEFIFPIINLGENKVYDNDFFSILSILKVIYKNNMIESKKKIKSIPIEEIDNEIKDNLENDESINKIITNKK